MIKRAFYPHWSYVILTRKVINERVRAAAKQKDFARIISSLSFGFFWSGVYEHFTWNKLVKNHYELQL